MKKFNFTKKWLVTSIEVIKETISYKRIESLQITEFVVNGIRYQEVIDNITREVIGYTRIVQGEVEILSKYDFMLYKSLIGVGDKPVTYYRTIFNGTKFEKCITDKYSDGTVILTIQFSSEEEMLNFKEFNKLIGFKEYV